MFPTDNNMLTIYERVPTQSLLEYASKNRTAGFFNDVSIITENVSIPANRMVLSCYSTVFERMFKIDMKEKYESNATVSGVGAEPLKLLIDYMYTGSITVTSDNVFDLLAAADYLQMDEVKEWCFNFLDSSLKSDNCFSILAVATFYRNDRVTDHVLEFISNNFCDLSRTDEFKSLPKEALGAIFKSMDQTKLDNQVVYEAIIQWTKNDLESRKSDFFEFFRLVKLYYLPKEYLENVVATEALVKENPTCSKLLIDHLFLLINKQETPSQPSQSLVSIGGCFSRNQIIEVFNLQGKPPTQFSLLPVSFEYHVSLKMKNYLYCIGGLSNDKPTSHVWRCAVDGNNFKNWERVGSMNTKRNSLGAAVYQKKVVVVGGRNDNKN